jgi:hypothetical protein
VNTLKPVYICGASSISSWGFDWREMGQKLLESQTAFAPVRQLQEFTDIESGTPAVIGSEVSDIPNQYDVEPRSRKFMSHPARLAAVALKLLIAETNWSTEIRQDVAFYLGVGASGAAMSELEAMLAASIQNHQFSVNDFGAKAINACNPLFAFQLMNNFTLCHAAILHGIGGANSAFYSRGTGTVAALQEARWQVTSGAVNFAIAGGADSALHPVTWAQLAQTSQIVPGEGAALLALSEQAESAFAELGVVDYVSELIALPKLLSKITDLTESDLLLLAPCNLEKRRILQHAVSDFGLKSWDISLLLGEALAATPVLTWCTALALLTNMSLPSSRIFIISAGLDDGVGLVEIRRPI